MRGRHRASQGEQKQESQKHMHGFDSAHQETDQVLRDEIAAFHQRVDDATAHATALPDPPLDQ
jgi:hypothetical protein